VLAHFSNRSRDLGLRVMDVRFRPRAVLSGWPSISRRAAAEGRCRKLRSGLAGRSGLLLVLIFSGQFV
jgi:hypothetical protein